MTSLRVRVVTAYDAVYSEALKVKAGDVLKVIRYDDEYPGWIWCSDAQDRRGWVPESFADVRLSICTMKMDYDATELTAAVGEILNVVNEESEWLWCAKENGQKGWIPILHTERM